MVAPSSPVDTRTARPASKPSLTSPLPVNVPWTDAQSTSRSSSRRKLHPNTKEKLSCPSLRDSSRLPRLKPFSRSSSTQTPNRSSSSRSLIPCESSLTTDDRRLVFSQFTKLLDLIEPHFVQAGIPYVRFDGSMTVKKVRSISSLSIGVLTRIGDAAR